MTGLLTIPGLRALHHVDLQRLILDGHVAVRDPTPPMRAIAMAMRASVTVSMALLTNGTRNCNERG